MSNWRQPAGDFDPTYLGYWRGALGLTAEDEAAFACYRRLRRLFDQEREERPSLTEAFDGLGFPFPVATSALRPVDAFALAFLEADTWEELLPRLDALLGPKRSAEIRGALIHLRQRFGKVMRRTLFLDAYVVRAHAVLAQPAVAAFLEALPALFGLHPEDAPTFHVRLAWLPPEAEQTRATLTGTHALVELRDGLGLRHILDVAVHEFAHRLHEKMPLDARRRFAAAFLSAPEAAKDGRVAHAAANTLFESLATSLGQGLFAERFFSGDFDAERAWYEDPSYDTMAKATKPLVARYLDEKRGLDPAFAHAYVATYAKKLATAGRADILRRAILVGGDARTLRAATGHVLRTVRPRVLLERTADERDALGRSLRVFPGMTVIVVGSPAQIAGLGALGLPVPQGAGRPGAGPVLVYSGADPLAAFQAAWPAGGPDVIKPKTPPAH